MNTAPRSAAPTLDLRHLAELALRSVTETQKKLNQQNPWDIEAVRRFFVAANEFPFAHGIAMRDADRLIDSGRKERKAAPRLRAGDVDILALPVKDDDSYEVWKRRWRFSIEIHGLAAADVTRPENSRNTWFTRQLSR